MLRKCRSEKVAISIYNTNQYIDYIWEEEQDC